MKGGLLTPKLIISLSLGFVVLGVKADSINGQSLQDVTLEAETTSSYPQFLIPNSRLRVLIAPNEEQVTSSETIPEEMDLATPLRRSWENTEAQTPNIVKYPDGTISMTLERRHLKYMSAQSCTDPEPRKCKGKDVQIRH